MTQQSHETEQAPRPMHRRGLGRGLGSLIPTGPRSDEAPGSSTPDPGRPGADWIGSPRPALDDREDGAGGVAAADRHVGDHSGPATDDAGSPPAPSTDAVGPATAAGTGDEAGAADSDPSGDRAATGLRPVAGARFAELDVDLVDPNPRQPREVFDEEAMSELVHSITEVGLLQPVVVRPTAGERFELVMGERRWRATKAAGLRTIPAIVRETGDDALLRDALLENLHRAELNALEEAAAYQQLLDDFGCTHEELAARIGRSRPQISNTIRLLKLSPPVQRRVAAGVLSAGHARALLAVDDAEVQDRLAARVVAEGISVRALEEIVAVGDLGTAPRAARHKPTAPRLDDVAARLSDRLETRVKVDLGKRKGRISIEFASIGDLERLVDIIDPATTPTP